MFGHPTLLAGHITGDTKGETLLAQQGIAAVAGADAPDQFLFRKMENEAAIGIQIAE